MTIIQDVPKNCGEILGMDFTHKKHEYVHINMGSFVSYSLALNLMEDIFSTSCKCIFSVL
jgi:hypothetical protein